MEIYHGFLRKPFTPVHAFMYERDPEFISTISEPNEKRIFAFDYEGNTSILERRDKLRCAPRPARPARPASCLTHPRPRRSADIRAHTYCASRHYTCTYGGLDEEGKPHVSNLEVRAVLTLHGLCAQLVTPSTACASLRVSRSKCLQT